MWGNRRVLCRVACFLLLGSVLGQLTATCAEDDSRTEASGPAVHEEVKAAQKLLQGTWGSVGHQRDGKPYEQRNKMRLVIQGDEGRRDTEPNVCPHAALLDKLVPELMDKYHVPGVSLAGIENCRVAWDRQYGVRRAGSPEKVDRETVFEACSMSKTPLAYLTLKLVEEGKLDLDRPLVQYLDEPYLADEPLHEKIAARMALSHTTGFPNWRKGGSQSTGPLSVEFEPGSKFGYSGEGYVYLQRVVEHITGTPFEQYVQQELFGPLGMTISSYEWQDRYEILAAAGHDSEGRVKADRRHFTRANAGYSLYSTPCEYAQYLVEYLTPDRSAPHSLSEASLAAMFTPTTEATGRKPVRRTVAPASDKVSWGLGWAIDKTEAGDRIYHAGANGTGFRCYSQFDQAAGTGLVIMTNSTSGRKLWEAVVEAIAP